MNNVTLKVDYQGVNHPDQVAKPIDPKAAVVILSKWSELAEAVSQKVKLPKSQHFSWYLHIGFGWANFPMAPEQKSVEGHAEVTVWEKVPRGGEFAVTHTASVFILEDKYCTKFAGETPIAKVVEQIAKRFKE